MTDYGHGCATLDLPVKAGGFLPTYVMGPRRAMLKSYPVEFPAPGGDMMLAGCFGFDKRACIKRCYINNYSLQYCTDLLIAIVSKSYMQAFYDFQNSNDLHIAWCF